MLIGAMGMDYSIDFRGEEPPEPIGSILDPDAAAATVGKIFATMPAPDLS